MTWTLIIILIAIGFLFFLLEILVIPGTGVAGIIGFGLIAFGIYQAFHVFGVKLGIITLGSTAVITSVLLYLALKSNTWKKASLKTNIDGKVNINDFSKVQVGDEGITISRLSPMGKARFGTDYFEVKTNGEVIAPKTKVVIFKIEHQQIYVKTK